jgi:thymidylate synthase ThyX
MKKAKNYKIIVRDDIPPEANAMLQALYSRSPQSVLMHFDKVAEVGPEKFMGTFYVGYGHKSIGDCGTTTIYGENVSILAAKAIQDWSLYNGQEASTRYLNMSAQEVLNPMGTQEGRIIQEKWMAIYERALSSLIPFLKQTFPKAPDEDEKFYNKAVNAKAFDIARCFLPAGATTYASWHTNLRQAYDHLQQMEHHPLDEMRAIARDMMTELKSKYPSSFSHKRYPDQEDYLKFTVGQLTYFNDPSIKKFKAVSRLDLKGLRKNREILQKRPTKTELPHQLRKYGDMRFTFPLDFGSYRDLQRHRSAVIMMPLLTIDYGFFPWYLEQLPKDVLAYVKKEIALQEKRIKKLKCSPEVKQYYIALGYTTTCEVTASLPAAIYIAELRSSDTVHPTLRKVAQQMGQAILEFVPGITMHHNMAPDKWNIKRGKQDIVKKQ